MRKTLLIAAATLAAGVIAAQADSPVYSQNIVGYYNVPVPAGKFVIVGNQLNLDGTNSINNIFTGLVSDPNAQANTVIWTWNTSISQYSSYQYFTGADADNNFLLSGSVNGFYDNSGDLITVAPTVGNGFFIQHVVSGSTTWTNIFQAQ